MQPRTKGPYASPCTFCAPFNKGSTYVVCPNHDVSGRCAPDLDLALIANCKVPDGALGAVTSRLAT